MYDTSANLKPVVVRIELPLLLLLLLLRWLLLLLLLWCELLLPTELHNLPVRVRMLSQYKCRARCGSVFGYEPTRFVSHTASVTKRFWAHWAGPPLGRLLRCAVRAPTRPCCVRRRSFSLRFGFGYYGRRFELRPSRHRSPAGVAPSAAGGGRKFRSLASGSA